MVAHIAFSEVSEVIKANPTHAGIKCFVETGTYRGDTIFPMAAHFETLHTIELGETFHTNAVAEGQRRGITNITFHRGDSAEVLPNLIQEINEPIVYYLDGHYCGSRSDGVYSELPLLQEVEAINKLHNYADMLIIDDRRLFGTNDVASKLDWSMITEDAIVSRLPGRVVSYFAKNDRFYVLLRPLEPDASNDPK